MIEIKTIDKKHTKFVESSLGRSLDNISGQLTFSMSQKNIENIEIGVGVPIDVFIDGQQKFMGWVEFLEKTEEGTSTEQTFNARDIVSDFIDSSLPDSVKVFKTGMDAKILIERVLSALKIKDVGVINRAGNIEPFSWMERVSAESGADAFGFVSDYLRKRGLFMNTDGMGNIVLFRITRNMPSEFSFENVIGGKNNVLTAGGKIDWSGRYNTYVCKSQVTVENSEQEEISFNRKGIAVDSEIRESRYFEFVGEESMTSEECKQRAEEEANIRRARSLEYVVEVSGHSQNGKVFDIGKVARVNDEENGVKGDFLIRAVTYRSSASEGDTTEIVMTYSDAYSLEAEITQRAMRKSDVGRFISERRERQGKKRGIDSEDFGDI